MTAEAEPIVLEDALEELAIRCARENFASFFHLFAPRENYKYGRHTQDLLYILNSAYHDKLAKGKNIYLCVSIPPRHGKSDVISRRFPAWLMLQDPDLEIILSSYNFELASSFSFEVRQIVRDVLGPLYGLQISPGRSKIGSWRLFNSLGQLHAAGVGGTVNGRGAGVLIIDDYYKNRQEAESPAVRQTKWESFESDFMTRRAPTHAVILVANRWHEDDIVGRIQRKNNPNDDFYDEDFPVFENISFPAQDEESGEWLFPELLNDEWYRSMRAMVGSYAWNSQFLQNPKPRKGNLLRADLVEVVDKMPEGLPWVRGWDIASSEKERTRDDPDYTVGTKACYHEGVIYVDDVIRGQWTVHKREAAMKQAAAKDGSGVTVKVEVVAGYKDAYERMRKILSGKSIVRKYIPNGGDKVVRAQIMEPAFEIGAVKIKSAQWTDNWKNEFLSFPSGAHDDQVDSLGIAISEQIQTAGSTAVQKLW